MGREDHRTAGAMKILLVHNSYKIRAGEDAVADAEAALLAEHGHTVQRHLVSNDDIGGVWNRIETGLRSTYSAPARDRLAADLALARPDVVHVHNFFPLLTPAIYDACADAGVPVVQTLHNYRVLCPGATLFRDGHVCEICVTRSPFHSVRYGCYRGSRVGTLAVARMVAHHRRAATWRRKVSRFIALAEFARAKFIEAGLPAGRIVVKPNFVSAVPSDSREPRGEGAIFVGRLSPEKGISVLLEAWKELRVPLRILGGGALPPGIAETANPSVAFLGQVAKTEVAAWLERASFLILPSVWYEACPMACLEAMARGVPVIASRIGCIPELVRDRVTGLLFEAGSPAALAEAVRWAVAHPAEMRRMGEAARAFAVEHLSPEANHRMLMAIYAAAIEERRAAAPDGAFTARMRAAE
jgi:glycosyltransferase involved in cell wall biosynthesis